MSLKVTKEEFLEAVENNKDGKSNRELAVQLGISRQHFSNLKKAV